MESDVSQNFIESFIEKIMDPDGIVDLWKKFAIVMAIICAIVVGGSWGGLY